MRKLIPVLLLGFAAFALAQPGPLTNGANVRVRTDANGYLIAAAQTYDGPDGPLRPMANTLVRTDANGYLIITNPSGFGSDPSIGGDIVDGTAGSVLFVGSGSVFAQDNANLFWDDTNNRFGVGTISPGTGIEIRTPYITNRGQLYINAPAAHHSYLSLNADSNKETGIQFLSAAVTKWWIYRELTTDDLKIDSSSGGNVFTLSQSTGAITAAAGASALRFSNSVLLTFADSAGTFRPVFQGLDSGNTTVINAGTGGFLLRTNNANTDKVIVATANGDVGINANPPTSGFKLDVLGNVLLRTANLGLRVTPSADTVNAAFNFTNAASNVNWLTIFGTDAGAKPAGGHVAMNGFGVSIGTTSNPGAGTGWLVFGDGTAPSSMASNTAGLYANDVSGTVQMHAIDEAGTAVNIGGLKHQRVTTGSINGGSTGLVTITWTVAFPTANYTPACSVEDATATSLSLSIVHVETKTASAIAVRVLNNAVGALTGTLGCVAMHD